MSEQKIVNKNLMNYYQTFFAKMLTSITSFVEYQYCGIQNLVDFLPKSNQI